MRKFIFTLAPIVLAVLVGTNVAQAANNAQLTVTAYVVASTCEIFLSTANLDLGNHSKTAFTVVAIPVASSIKNFTMGLSNC